MSIQAVCEALAEIDLSVVSVVATDGVGRRWVCIDIA